MKKERTIVEAIEKVLKENNKGMDYREIYAAVIRDNLYEFGAKNPQAVLHSEIRRHCKGIDFPTASPIKYFKLIECIKGVNYYGLDDSENVKLKSSIENEHLNVNDEILPEERMVKAYELYIKDLKNTLIDKIRECHPSFFEKIVVDLLLAMGYGCDDKSGQVIGNSHDCGIDGIISEDKLGLNLIYIQAKRYNEGNNVGRPEVQRFIGAMQKAEKGVFIATSKFTKEAIDFVNAETQKHIRLIDGETLVDLMIKNSVGLEMVKKYVIYRIDGDYFEENM